MHPGINVHFDLLCLNKHCWKVFCHKDFKLPESDRNSYGFPFVGFVSMETLLTFDLELFVKISKILISDTVNIFFNVSYFFIEPTMGRVIPCFKIWEFMLQYCFMNKT